MSEPESRDVVLRYFAEVWDPENPANPEALQRLLSPSVRRHVSAAVPPLDLDAQIERLAGIRAGFPDINFTVEDVVTEGDRVVVRATMRGTHTGEFVGIPPTANQVTVSAVDIFRVEGGQIVDQWGGPDVFDLLRQLGATVRVGD